MIASLNNVSLELLNDITNLAEIKPFGGVES